MQVIGVNNFNTNFESKIKTHWTDARIPMLDGTTMRIGTERRPNGKIKKIALDFCKKGTIPHTARLFYENGIGDNELAVLAESIARLAENPDFDAVTQEIICAILTDNRGNELDIEG